MAPRAAHSDAEILGFVAANVRRARLRRGLTQEALAERANLSVVHLQRVERGSVDLRVTMLSRLAQALEVPVSRLMRPATAVARPAGRPVRGGRGGTQPR